MASASMRGEATLTNAVADCINIHTRACHAIVCRSTCYYCARVPACRSRAMGSSSDMWGGVIFGSLLRSYTLERLHYSMPSHQSYFLKVDVRSFSRSKVFDSRCSLLYNMPGAQFGRIVTQTPASLLVVTAWCTVADRQRCAMIVPFIHLGCSR